MSAISGNRSRIDVVVSPSAELPELMAFARLIVVEARDYPFQPHEHDCLEIHCVESGTLWWWLGANRYEVSGGDIFVVQPGERHGGRNDVLHPSKFFSLHLALAREDQKSWLALPAGEAEALNVALRNLPARHFRSNPSLASSFHQLSKLLADPTGIAAAKLRGVLLQLLVDVVGCCHAAEPDVSPEITRASRIMRENVTEPVALQKIAREVGMSLPHFKHRFRQETGVAPGTYYLTHRIAEASRRLATTAESITNIAHQTGFASSQHFATTFGRIVGVTPSEFRSAHDQP